MQSAARIRTPRFVCVPNGAVARMQMEGWIARTVPLLLCAGFGSALPDAALPDLLSQEQQIVFISGILAATLLLRLPYFTQDKETNDWGRPRARLIVCRR